jgi:hypothetical protein
VLGLDPLEQSMNIAMASEEMASEEMASEEMASGDASAPEKEDVSASRIENN